MNELNKDDAPRSTPTPPRSGSDTTSAANISAGTSVGNAGQPATPYGQQGTPGSSSQGSGSATPYGAGSSTQGTGSDWARSAASDATRYGGGSSPSTGDTSRSSGAAARDQSGSALDQASDWTREQYRQGARQLYQARNNSMQQLRSAGGSIERFASENPLMVGVIGVAAGLVIGTLLPRTRQEDRAFGRWADEVREQGMRYARDATQRGREYVEEALGGADSDEDEWRPDDRGGVRSSGPRYQNH